MELMEYTKTYQEYKQELDAVLTRTAEDFVQIGYLLKVARDTNILAESGYATVTDFAKAEYGIDKTQVSRFISINDRFSEGGYSDHLLPNYKGFGYAKLTLMLQIPDEINEALSPTLSKAEIQDIKDEVDAESKVTDIEVEIERAEAAAVTDKSMLPPEGSPLHRNLWQLGKESLFVGDVGRDTADGSGVMGNDLPFVTIATGSRLQKFSILIGQLYSQAIQFEHQHHLLLTHEIQKIHTALSLIQRQQRDLMSGFLQPAHRRIAYCLGWRICHLDSRFLFQLFQLVKESVIDLI